MVRKGLGKGKGKGYKNIIGKDPKVHSDSAKGRKQPQKLQSGMFVVSKRTGVKGQINKLNPFSVKTFNPQGKVIHNRLSNPKFWTPDSDGDGVPDSQDCRPFDKYAQDDSKLFPINNEYSISARWEKTRNGFRHVAVLYKNYREIARTKQTYLNRTWESFEYETVINKLLDSAYGLSDDERQRFKQLVKKGETERFEEQNKTISAIAGLGEIFANTKEEKNKWKEKMLKAGLPALDFPEDWDTLTESEKEDRLNKVIKELKGKKIKKEQNIKSFNYRIGETFQSKANRDKRYKELKEKYGDKFRKTSSRGQLLHPQYVEDWEGEVQTGIGNTQYKTMFPVLYNIELKYGETWDG